MSETTLVLRLSLPSLLTSAGERARILCFEFFASNIRNPNTRQAYAHAAGEFVTLVCAGWRDVDRGRAAAACGMPGSSYRRRCCRRQPSSNAWRRLAICSIGSPSTRSCSPTPQRRYEVQVTPRAKGKTPVLGATANPDFSATIVVAL
jgi:hypothetical protein